MTIIIIISDVKCDANYCVLHLAKNLRRLQWVLCKLNTQEIHVRNREWCRKWNLPLSWPAKTFFSSIRAPTELLGTWTIVKMIAIMMFNDNANCTGSNISPFEMNRKKSHNKMCMSCCCLDSVSECCCSAKILSPILCRQILNFQHVFHVCEMSTKN